MGEARASLAPQTQEALSVQGAPILPVARASDPKGNCQAKRRTTMPPAGSVAGRKRLSDITNIVNSEESVKAAPSAVAKDYVAQLINENSALLKLLGERNNMIDMISIELQKLRVTLQKANQQNWQLARANSQMLAELNLGKDRLKALQHELGCTLTILKTKTFELEEVKRMTKQEKQLPMKISHEGNNNSSEAPAESLHLSSDKVCNLTRKRTLRSQSLGSSISTNQAASKDTVDQRRRSLRRKSNNLKRELCEPTEDLFEIKDIKFPIHPLTGQTVNDDNSVQLGLALAHPMSNAMNPVKIEVQEERISSKDQGSRRSSLGRPLRKAAEKVTCYKEFPLNIKLRRDN